MQCAGNVSGWPFHGFVNSVEGHARYTWGAPDLVVPNRICCLRALARLTVGAIFFAGIPSAAQPAGRLMGSVKDATGLPLPGVTVTIDGPARREVMTSNEGSFDFQGLPPGEYGLDTLLGGFSPVHRTVRVN